MLGRPAPQPFCSIALEMVDLSLVNGAGGEVQGKSREWGPSNDFRFYAIEHCGVCVWGAEASFAGLYIVSFNLVPCPPLLKPSRAVFSQDCYLWPKVTTLYNVNRFLIYTGYSCKVRATWGRVGLGGWRSWIVVRRFTLVVEHVLCAERMADGMTTRLCGSAYPCAVVCRSCVVARALGSVAVASRRVVARCVSRPRTGGRSHTCAMIRRFTGVSRASHGRLTGARRFTHPLQAGGFVTLIADRTLGRSGARRPRLALAGFRRAEGQSLAFCLRVACRQDWHRR